MIFSDSRYADSANTPLIFKAWNADKQQYDATVFRNWPTYVKDYTIYQWTDGDRLDKVALKFLGDPSLWWQVMDINPEITNPSTITSGTLIRIPSA
jgi:hypothetical protein